MDSSLLEAQKPQITSETNTKKRGWEAILRGPFVPRQMESCIIHTVSSVFLIFKKERERALSLATF